MSQSTPMVRVDGHPGIYSRGSRYVVVYRVRGKQHKRAFRTLTEARRFKAKADTGDAVTAGKRPTVVGYAENWLDGYKGRSSGGLRDSTRSQYKDAVDRIIVPYFKKTAPSLKLEDLKPSMLRTFIDHLGERYAKATVSQYFAVVRVMLATAYEDDVITSNPATGIRVTVPQRQERKRKALTKDEMVRILNEIPEQHRDLVYLLAATGLRISEAVGLVWSDFAVSKEGATLTVRESKTEAGRRTLPLTSESARMLTKRRTKATDKHGPVFPNRLGGHIDTRNWRKRVFNPAAESAGVEWATPHKFRHGLASLMADSGATAAQIASYLGHADGGQLALRTYIRAAMIEPPEFIEDGRRGGNQTGNR